MAMITMPTFQLMLPGVTEAKVWPPITQSITQNPVMVARFKRTGTVTPYFLDIQSAFCTGFAIVYETHPKLKRA